MRSMGTSDLHRRNGRLATLVVAGSLLGIAFALAVYALAEWHLGALVRGLVLPGEGGPDTSTFDGAVGVAVLGIVLSIAAAALVLGSTSRRRFLVAALWSLVMVAIGVWLLVGASLPSSIAVGPLRAPTPPVGLITLLIALLGVAGSVFGWAAAEPEPEVPPYVPPPGMPPPTHLGG